MAEQKLLDAKALAKLSTVSLKAKYVVEGFITGLHKSQLKGFSQEFAHHREYVPGDDLRYLDWKVLARTDHHFIKQFKEETNLRAHLVVDTSSSMKFTGSNGISKLDYAKTIAASLAYIIINQGDMAGLALFNDTLVHHRAPGAERSYLKSIFDDLENTEAGSKSDFEVSFKKLGGLLRKRNMIIIISDLLGNPDDIVRAISYFKYKKNEVIVFQILTKEELNLNYKGPVRFKDLETNEFAVSTPDLIRSEYIEMVNNHIETLKAGFRKADIEYCLATTDMSFDIMLGAYITKRR